MKKAYRVLCMALGLMLCILAARQASLPVRAVTSESIQEKEDQISQAKEEKENLQNNLSNMEKIKSELEKERKDLKNYVTQLDAALAEIQQNIESLKVQIAEKEEEIRLTQEQLDAAMEQEESQRQAIIVSARLMYEQSDTYMVDMLAGSSSFNDFLNQADFMESILQYNKQIFEEYQMNRQYIELCKEGLELEKEILDQTKANVEIEEQNLQALIDQKNRDITAYETDINTKEKAIKEYQEEIALQEQTIRELEELIAEEKRRLIANNGQVLTYDGGMFKQPIASYTKISSDYGPRTHPTLGINHVHNGVDFAAPTGTAIYAAYDGVVVAATYSAVMGNYIMIDHGSGLYTIYMHASALYVKKDDVVVKGETIAAVGATGRTTGSHLHFSVRVDGSYVSPWNYLSE